MEITLGHIYRCKHSLKWTFLIDSGACPGGGAWPPPPPLEIEKQK